MPTSAKGTLQDNQKKSFVDSPSRGAVDTAQEVYVGNQTSTSFETRAQTELLAALSLTAEILIKIEIHLQEITKLTGMK